MSDIVIRPVRLPHGQELICFDDAGSPLPRERSADPRHLDPRPTGDLVPEQTAERLRATLQILDDERST